MIIVQTVEITEDGVLRLELPLPQGIPVGSKVNVTVTPELNDFSTLTPYVNVHEAIERCYGLGKRIGSHLTSDIAIEMNRKDRELEDAKYQRLYGNDGNKN